MQLLFGFQNAMLLTGSLLTKRGKYGKRIGGAGDEWGSDNWQALAVQMAYDCLTCLILEAKLNTVVEHTSSKMPPKHAPKSRLPCRHVLLGKSEKNAFLDNNRRKSGLPLRGQIIYSIVLYS